MLTSVPPGQRSIEILDRHVILFVYDKATLDEDDIAGASVMVFGRSDRPLVHRVGSRTFVAPGSLGSPGGGIVVLDDESEPGIRIEFLDSEGAVVSAERIESRAPRAAGKLKVQGSGS